MPEAFGVPFTPYYKCAPRWYRRPRAQQAEFRAVMLPRSGNLIPGQRS
jgi:hypothetical protein